MPRSSRLALWCLALLISLTLYLKGRVTTEMGGDAAFFSGAAGPGLVTVRLAGDFPRPGLYHFPDGASLRSAIKMTLPDLPLAQGALRQADRPLRPGDLVTLEVRPGQGAVFSTGSMAVRELMLLGIPLDPDRLKAADWACLPGIGPVLSERIVADRHKNGAFGSVEALTRVPGIGAAQLSALRRYF